MIGGFAGSDHTDKNSFLDEVRKQYVVTARAKGKEKYVLWKHVFRNAMRSGEVSATFISTFFTGSLR